MRNYISHIMEGGWNIGIRNVGTGTILKDRKIPFKLIPNTWRTWAADPFVFEKDGKVYIFAELFDYITRKGSIGYTCLCNEKWSKWKVIISEPYHMSYPNVFDVNGKIYMIPETSAGHELRLYESVEFPDKWCLKKIIQKQVDWVDTTFWIEDGIRYAITTDISSADQHEDYLLVFDNQFNVIKKTKIDERRTEYSRCAGNFFREKNSIIRVSQDCSKHYGGAMQFSKFELEKVCEYGMEEEFLHLQPADINVSSRHKWTGLHTYNSTDSYEVIDIERKHFNIFGIISRILLKIKK